MKFFQWAATVMIAAVVMIGCDGDREEVRAREAVPIFQEFKGQQGPFPDRGFFVVQSLSTWQALWEGRQAPNINFEQYSVLVALMGRQPTAGYSVDITDVRATGTEVIATVNETRPRPGEQVAQVITYPYHMVVVPRVTQPVAFNVEGQPLQPVAVQQQFTGQQSMAVNPQTVVIRDAETWRTFWVSTFGPTSPVPEVNFDRYMATAVLLGRRPTAGYSVFITGAAMLPERIEVNYRATAPAPGDPVAQVITSPYAIAILPASPQAIAFRPVSTTAVATAPAMPLQ